MPFLKKYERILALQLDVRVFVAFAKEGVRKGEDTYKTISAWPKNCSKPLSVPVLLSVSGIDRLPTVGEDLVTPGGPSVGSPGCFARNGLMTGTGLMALVLGKVLRTSFDWVQSCKTSTQ